MVAIVRTSSRVCGLGRMPRIRRGTAALWVLIALLATTVVALGYEVRLLKPKADELIDRKALPYIGQLVPRVRVATMSGDSVTVGETTKGRSQVLFFLTTTCPYCKATYPEWTKLALRLLQDSAQRFDVYGVSFSPKDSTLAFVAEQSPPFPIVTIDDDRVRKLFRVKGVPISLVIDPNGQVAFVHPSIIASDAQRNSIFAAAELVATVTAKQLPRHADSIASLGPPKSNYSQTSLEDLC